MKEHYHLIGIGGIGMSGIARLLLARGAIVSGSDLKEGALTLELSCLGAQVFIGHRRENLRGADFVVFSSAVKDDNPEMLEAKRLNIPCLKRAEALARLMEEKTVIAVTGSHGKTTTTSLVSFLLLEAGLFPTIAIGGILRNISKNAYLGTGDYFVAEADESDGSFLCYRPKYSIITNIDREHLDYYGNFRKEVKAFAQFLRLTDKDGCVFACSDDAVLKRLLRRSLGKRRIFFGLNKDADIRADKICLEGLTSKFDCIYKGKFLERFHLSLGGLHNIKNALAVIALGCELGIEVPFIKKTLSGYLGAERRLQVRFDDGCFTLIDDYAHHPTEIKASLAAVRNLNKPRVVAVFQPHRYTRTKLLLEDFAASFEDADTVVLTDIYPAGEEPIAGVDARNIYELLKNRFPEKFVDLVPKSEVSRFILNYILPGDLIISLGAGDIIRSCEEIEQGLRKRSEVRAPA